MVVRELLTKWGFDLDEGPLRRLDASISSVKVGVAAVLGAASAAAAALFGLAASTAKSGDEAREMAQRVGLNAELLQELAHAARLGGVDAAALEGSLNLLNRKMVEAASKGGEAAAAFRAVGVSVKRQDGSLRSADEVLLLVADRFKAMPDGARKSALAMGMFGRSGAAMIPVLNQGAAGIAAAGKRAREYGAVLSDEATTAGDAFSDSLVELDAMIVGLKNRLGVELMPVVQALIGRFGEWLIQNKELIAQKAHEAIEMLKSALKTAWEWGTKFKDALAALSDKLGGAEGAVGALRIAVEFLLAKMAAGFVVSFAGALVQLAGAFSKAKLAATALNLAVALLPTLIATAVTMWIERWDEISAFPRELADGVGMMAQAIGERLAAVGDWFRGLAGSIRDAFAEAFDWVMGKVEAVREFVRGALGKAADVLGLGGGDGVRAGAGGLPAITPQNAPVAGAGGRSVNVDARLEFNLPAGAPVGQAEQLASHVRRAVRQEIGAMTREAVADHA